MPLARRRQREQGLFAVERPPRLVLRFAVVLSVALALAAALILVVVRSFTVMQAERAATRQASLVAATLLRTEVVPGDFRGPVSALRERELDELFRTHVVSNDTLGVSLVRRDGLVTYSTDHDLIGTRGEAPLATEAASGTIVSRSSSARSAGTVAGTKVLETFTPVGGAAGDRGAASIVQAYEPIERDAQRALLWVGGVLEGLLLVLFAVFVPLLARVTRRIGSQIDRIHEQAYYDDLTGLANRAHLRERFALALSRAAAGGQKLACVLVDVDHFREINDTLGHDAGDEALRQLAGRLRELVDGDTLLSRPQGDQFVLVCEYESEEDVLALAARARSAVEQPLEVAGIHVALAGSVGIALHPRDGDDGETLFRRADVALHGAKARRIGVLTYSPEVDPHDPDELRLVADLRGAAARGELVPHYQPKVDLAGNVVAGFETLTYWQHSTRGLLSPGVFIPVAERMGAIRHLTRDVFELAVGQLCVWRDRGEALPLAVNLSPVDLLDLQFADDLAGVLAERGIEPRLVCLEITETTVMADVDRAHSVLDGLAASGFRLSIDDFGTGHSSLAYLKNLPVHEVKIDRELVSGIASSAPDRTIVRSTIEMAHSLGLAVVAEGVETREQEALLRSLGCDYAQGYLYSRPLPAADLEAALTGFDLAAA
jgi:diguanylate cyclase (GGDEF)-like protein